MANKDFVTTHITLLSGMASRETGERESNWNRFFELYYPAMLRYAEMFCGVADAEDIVQDVLAKLVEILRSGRYERWNGTKFRNYLKRLIRNGFIDWRRTESSRRAGCKLPVDENALVCDETAPDVIDKEWCLALRAHVTEHVLSAGQEAARLPRICRRGASA